MAGRRATTLALLIAVCGVCIAVQIRGGAFQRHFDTADTNKDGVLDREEFVASQMQQKDSRGGFAEDSPEWEERTVSQPQSDVEIEKASATTKAPEKKPHENPNPRDVWIDSGAKEDTVATNQPVTYDNSTIGAPGVTILGPKQDAQPPNACPHGGRVPASEYPIDAPRPLYHGMQTAEDSGPRSGQQAFVGADAGSSSGSDTHVQVKAQRGEDGAWEDHTIHLHVMTPRYDAPHTASSTGTATSTGRALLSGNHGITVTASVPMGAQDHIGDGSTSPGPKVHNPWIEDYANRLCRERCYPCGYTIHTAVNYGGFNNCDCNSAYRGGTPFSAVSLLTVLAATAALWQRW